MKLRSGNKTMPISTSNLEKLLGAVFSSFTTAQRHEDSVSHAKHRRDFIFHMTDWKDDLDRLAELYQNPENFDKKQASQIVAGFLYHVIPHLQEAGRLMLEYDPGDVFAESSHES